MNVYQRLEATVHEKDKQMLNPESESAQSCSMDTVKLLNEISRNYQKFYGCFPKQVSEAQKTDALLLRSGGGLLGARLPVLLGLHPLNLQRPLRRRLLRLLRRGLRNRGLLGLGRLGGGRHRDGRVDETARLEPRRHSFALSKL